MGILYTPRTWVDGELETAAVFNSEVRDPFTGLQAAWTTDGRAASTIWTAVTVNPVIGNGTLVSRYLQVGKTLDWQVLITMGSTTTFGTGSWQLTMPFTARAVNTGDWQGRALDSSVSTTQGFPITADLTSTTILSLRCANTVAGGQDRVTSTANPFTWATSDVLSVTGRVELA